MNVTYLKPQSLGSATHNKLIRSLIVARLDAECWLAPLGLGRHTARRVTFTTTVRVVDRVHRRTTDMGPNTQPSRTSGLANGDVLMIDIADLSDRRHTLDMDTSHLARWQTHGRVVAFLCHQLSRRASGADNLTAATTLQFDVMDLRTQRNRCAMSSRCRHALPPGVPTSHGHL